MSADLRVQADAIDSVMANPLLFFLDVAGAEGDRGDGQLRGVRQTFPWASSSRAWGELPKDRPILPACGGGGRASRAGSLLEKNGFKVTGFCGLKDYKGAKGKPARKSDK